ncbi:hypothetical protein ACVSQ4_28100, partial [Klebsiella pneumoniae]|jgi:hypothetical protein
MNAKDRATAHKRRFRRWQSNTRRETRVLSELLEEKFVAVFLGSRFEWVGVNLTRPDWPVDTKEIVLERANSDLIDYVVVNFEKHSAPRFQIHFGRRRNTVDNEFIRSGNLVKNPHEYYHFWGKPAWLPTRFWSDNSAQRVVSTVTSMVDEIIAFIEFGEKGENISIHFWASTSLGAP